MNRQGKLVNGKVVGWIDWLKYILPDGTERCGYTWNSFGGLANHKWRAGLEKLRAIDEDNVIGYEVIKRAYQERKA